LDRSVNKRIAIGAGWNVAIGWMDKLIGLVSIAILARLLPPADFGLVGYAMVFLAFLEMFSAFNFQTVLIRDQDAPDERYNTAWTLDLLKGLLLAAIIIAAARITAEFFNEPKVEEILYVVSVIPVLTGLVNVGIVNFQKEIEFDKLFYLNVATRLTGSIATVVLALVIRNYWALVYGWLARMLVKVLLSYVMSNFRPRFCISEWRRVMGFSSWLLVNNAFVSIHMQLPAILIGRYFEAQALAFFNVSKELTNSISGQLAAPIRTAMFPGLAKMQNDHGEMERTLVSALGVIVLVGLPMTVGIGVTAPLIVPVLLGDKWIPMTPIVTALCVASAINLFYSNSHSIFAAQNRPKITTFLTISRVSYTAPALALVVPMFGAIGASWTLASTNLVGLLVNYAVLFRLTKLTTTRVASVVWRSIIATTIMAICVKLIVQYPFTLALQSSEILHLFFCVTSGAVIHVLALTFLWWISGRPPGPEVYILRILASVFRRLLRLGSNVRTLH
jgi:O-antigen/teichoic acid export membrane protein